MHVHTNHILSWCQYCEGKQERDILITVLMLQRPVSVEVCMP